MVLQTGTLLQGGKYRIERVLGQGSFGITYLATTSVKLGGSLGSLETKMSVAIKEFFMQNVNGREDNTVTCSSKDGLFEKYRGKFKREAQSLSKMQHPNIVKVLEQFEENNTYYYVMEYCEGGSFDSLIANKGTLSETEAKEYFRYIASALSYMHSKKMLHLDIKPSNIMIRANGEVVLIDFGLSKQFDENGKAEDSTTIGGGTPGYAPLEQMSYNESAADGLIPVTMDVYALGATLYKMLSGVRPGDSSKILNDGFPEAPLKAKGVSQHSIDCIKHAMMPKKSERCQSVDELMKMFVDKCVVEKNEDTELVDKTKHDRVIDEDSTKKNEETSFDTERLEKPVTPVQPTNPIDEGDKKPKRKSSKIKWIVISVIVAVLAYSGYWVYDFFSGKPKIVLEDVALNSTEPGRAVDLGLSVKWADRNVGASSAEDFGAYFSWGELKPKHVYIKSAASDVDDDISDDSNYDAASSIWGDGWRMPTNGEMKELIEECSWTRTEQDGVEGYKVTGPNGNSIFLPATGYNMSIWVDNCNSGGRYWTSTPSAEWEDGSYALYWYYGSSASLSDRSKTNGFAIRPVRGSIRKHGDKSMTSIYGNDDDYGYYSDSSADSVTVESDYYDYDYGYENVDSTASYDYY